MVFIADNSLTENKEIKMQVHKEYNREGAISYSSVV